MIYYFSKNYLQEKLQHAGFQKYLKNTSWLFLSRIVNMAVAFFIGAYVARYLGPDLFGILSYTISFVGLFSFIAGLGIDGILVRDLVNYPEKKDDFLGTSFFLKIGGSVVAILVIAITSFFINKDYYTQILIILFSLTTLIQATGVIDCFFQANVLSKKVVYVQIPVVIVSGLLKLLLIWSGVGLFWFVLVYVFDALFTGIGLFYAYAQSGLSIRTWRFDYMLAKSILRSSWPLMLSVGMSMIYLKIDQVMIRTMLGNYSAGIYAAAVKLSEMWYFIPSIIISSFLPAIINGKKSNALLYYARYRKLYLLMFLAPFCLALGISYFANPLVKIVFGKEYLASAPALEVYIWAGIPVFIWTVFYQFLIVENLTKIIFFSTACGAISNILLNLVFIPAYGILGAAYATLISYSLVIILALPFKPVWQHFRALIAQQDI